MCVCEEQCDAIGSTTQWIEGSWKALGSCSWKALALGRLLALALGRLFASPPKRRDDALRGLETHGAKLWVEDPSRSISRLFPLFPSFFGTRPLHPSDATMRCEGWRLMGRSCGWKIHLDPSLGSSPLPPYPNQHQSTTTSRDISRVVLKSLGNVMSGVTLHGCLWCWAILYV